MTGPNSKAGRVPARGPGWNHPDRIDAISASGGVSGQPGQATPEIVARALGKVLVTGCLARIPKHPQHRDIVLAVLCSHLRRRHSYTELEINACLRESLDAMQARIDHVTCRRYLVDLGFLKRNRAGTRYLLNYPRLEATLSAEAASNLPALLQEALAGRRRSPSRR
jgi:hypothetical protein